MNFAELPREAACKGLLVAQSVRGQLSAFGELRLWHGETSVGEDARPPVAGHATPALFRVGARRKNARLTARGSALILLSASSSRRGPRPANVVNLFDALRYSIAAEKSAPSAAKRRKPPARGRKPQGRPSKRA